MSDIEELNVTISQEKVTTILMVVALGANLRSDKFAALFADFKMVANLSYYYSI